MSADLHASVARDLDVVGQRYTAGRRALVVVLAAAGRPVTLPDVLAASPGLAQSSAYRNLGLLEEAGVVHRLSGAGDFALYELAEHLTEHHHHLVCTVCGSVADVSIPPAVERAIDRSLDGVAAAGGFEVTAHRLDLVGRCADCARAARGTATGS